MERILKLKEPARTIPHGPAILPGEGRDPSTWAKPAGRARPLRADPARRARRLIGARLRHVLGSSDLLQETLLIAVRRFEELWGGHARQVLAWLLKSMQFRLMRYVRDHQRRIGGQGPSYHGQRPRGPELDAGPQPDGP